MTHVKTCYIDKARYNYIYTTALMLQAEKSFCRSEHYAIFDMFIFIANLYPVVISFLSFSTA
jgi:hypothetical protein